MFLVSASLVRESFGDFGHVRGEVEGILPIGHGVGSWKKDLGHLAHLTEHL